MEGRVNNAHVRLHGILNLLLRNIKERAPLRRPRVPQREPHARLLLALLRSTTRPELLDLLERGVERGVGVGGDGEGGGRAAGSLDLCGELVEGGGVAGDEGDFVAW